MPGQEAEPVLSVIENQKDSLRKLSNEIWENPELCYKEFHAHAILTAALEQYGFRVQKHYLLETAFRAEFSSGKEGPTVAVLCEYDALAEIGHACGHNLIAEVGVAAGLGIKAAMEADPAIPGKVVVLGCPAEEGGGGKLRLIEKGAFEDVDVALMAHPGRNTRLVPSMLCKLTVKVTYRGREAHASCYPWEGCNALDAAVAAYVNIGLLRQHVKPDCRIHGIITNGGAAPNIIPAKTELLFFLRAPTERDLQHLREKTRRCFESAAISTGCEVHCDFEDSNVYLNIISNPVLGSLYREHSESMGLASSEVRPMRWRPREEREFLLAAGSQHFILTHGNCISSVEFVDDAEALSRIPPAAGSTDMGNVSYAVPSIHPGFSIGPYCIHTPKFAEQATTDQAHRAALTTAKALALTALRMMKSPDLLQQAKQAYEKDVLQMRSPA